jgi:hypothetical protein
VKSVSAALEAHLGEETTTLATCWRITRTDGVEFFFTDHDRDLDFEGNLYLASTGYSRTAIANDASLAVDNLDVEGVFDAAEITEQDLRAGLFDHAEVRVFLVNWTNLGQGALRMRRGWFGEVTLSEQGFFRTELRGMTQALSQRIGELYSPECRADLGDHRCRVPIAPPEIARDTAYGVGDIVRVVTLPAGPDLYENRIYRCTTAGTTASAQPTYDTTPGVETTDGTAVFIAEEAWTRSGEVTVVIDRSSFEVLIDEPRATDGWFTSGVLTWLSGANAGRSSEVRDWVETPARTTLFLPQPFTIEVGDRFEVYPGCDKRLATCTGKFANVLNFRGEPHLPGQDEFLRYLDAK